MMVARSAAGAPAAARHADEIVITRPLNTCQQEKWTRAAAGEPAARHADAITHKLDPPAMRSRPITQQPPATPT
jgi:hypothetical protein